MNIDRIQVTVRELIDGYEERGTDGIEGVVAYGGKLDVRPAYQREFIYPDKDRDDELVRRYEAATGRKATVKDLRTDASAWEDE